MMYEVMVSIKNSPNKIKGWGYLIRTDTRQSAIEKALEYAKAKAMKPYSRFKKYTFIVEDKDVIEKPNW